MFKTTWKQYHQQLQYAEQEVKKLEESLRAEGYVNTIHDCWEKVDG